MKAPFLNFNKHLLLVVVPSGNIPKVGQLVLPIKSTLSYKSFKTFYFATSSLLPLSTK